MMTRNGGKNRDQIEFTSLDELVPEDHLVRKLENAIEWSFIYEMVEESYCEDNGRPSLDPVVLIKLPVLQYMFGIRSMRQTIQEIKVNNAYRWFLGLGLHDSVPHFSTFGKNYMRRFQDTDLFERIFQRILKECMEAGLVDESVVFVDSTHVKARANSKRYKDAVVEEQAQWYEKELREEIDRDREAHGKKPLKDEPEEPADDEEDPKPPKGSSKGKLNPNTSRKKKARQKKEKHIKQSTSDPESGWFRKGEHKNVFAYSVETACDINGVVLGYSVHPGNENDGKTFPGVYEKIEHLKGFPLGESLFVILRGKGSRRFYRQARGLEICVIAIPGVPAYNEPAGNEQTRTGGNTMELGKKIRALRLKAGLTQEQLSEKLGISPQSVSKWENAAAMPDITALPLLAEIFGVSIDELFDLTAEQRLNRIENRMDIEDELPPDLFREYEEFLKEQLGVRGKRTRALSLLAHLYHHRLEADARKVSLYAREAIRTEPGKKECQWLLQKAEGHAVWDWNAANHSRAVDFYREIVESDAGEEKTPQPYYYLIDNLIADHRTAEAEEYLGRLAKLPDYKPFMIPVYEAAIALAEYDEERADSIMEKALAEHGDDPDLLFEAAQYCARKCSYEKAVGYYEASYAAEEDRKPRYTDALEGIAVIREIMGEYQKAADARRRILDALKNEWGFTEESVIRETEREIERLTRKASPSPSAAADTAL